MRPSLQSLVDKLYSLPEENERLRNIQRDLNDLQNLSVQVGTLVPAQIETPNKESPTCR